MIYLNGARYGVKPDNATYATRDEWMASTAIIPNNVLCYEIGTDYAKLGDGTLPYSQLPYLAKVDSGEPIKRKIYKINESSVTKHAVALLNFETVQTISTTNNGRASYIGIIVPTSIVNNTVEVYLSGSVCPGFTGLTIGEYYYLDNNGIHTLTDTGHLMGRAVSTTEMLVISKGVSSVIENFKPNTPAITSPLANIVGTPIPFNIVATPYQSADGSAFYRSQWQISNDIEFTDIAHDTGAIAAPLQYQVTFAHGVVYGNDYFLRVRHLGTKSNIWSEWSAVRKVTLQLECAVTPYINFTEPGTHTWNVPTCAGKARVTVIPEYGADNQYPTTSFGSLISANTNNSWQHRVLKKLLNARHGHTAVYRAANQTTYLFGGSTVRSPIEVIENNPPPGKSNKVLNKSLSLLSSIETYTPNNGGSNIGSLTRPRLHHASALYNNRVYTFSGLTNDHNYGASAEYFDLTNNSTGNIAELPAARFGHSAVADTNGNIYIVGGCSIFFDDWVSVNGRQDTIRPAKTILRYNVSSNTYTNQTVLPYSMYKPSVAIDKNNRLYIFGGYGNDVTSGGLLETDRKGSNKLFRYNPANDTLVEMTSLPYDLRAPSKTYSITATGVCNAAVAVDNYDNIYIIGGDIYNGSGETRAVSAVYRYSVALDEWTRLDDLKYARSGATAVYNANNNTIQVIGGCVHGVPCNTTEILDLTKDSWYGLNSDFPISTLGKFGEIITIKSRTGYDGLHTSDSKTAINAIFNIGKTNDYLTPSAEVVRYPHEFSSTLPVGDTNMPEAKTLFRVVADKAGNIFAIGGLTGTVGNLALTDTVYMRNASTGSWTAKASLQSARHSFAAVIDSHDKIYVMGGYTSEGVTDTVEVYDPVTNTWTYTTQLNLPRHEHVAVIDSNDNIIVSHGRLGNGSYTQHTEMYDPIKKMWTFKANSNHIGSYGSAVVDDLGRMWVIGGTTFNENDPGATLPAMTISEFYSPVGNDWVIIKAPATTNINGYLHSAIIDNGGVITLFGGGNTANVTYSLETRPNFYGDKIGRHRGHGFDLTTEDMITPGNIGKMAGSRGTIEVTSLTPGSQVSITIGAIGAGVRIEWQDIIDPPAPIPSISYHKTAVVNNTIRNTKFDTYTDVSTWTKTKWDAGGLVPYTDWYTYSYQSPYPCERKSYWKECWYSKAVKGIIPNNTCIYDIWQTVIDQGPTRWVPWATGVLCEGSHVPPPPPYGQMVYPGQPRGSFVKRTHTVYPAYTLFSNVYKCVQYSADVPAVCWQWLWRSEIYVRDVWSHNYKSRMTYTVNGWNTMTWKVTDIGTTINKWTY